MLSEFKQKTTFVSYFLFMAVTLVACGSDNTQKTMRICTTGGCSDQSITTSNGVFNGAVTQYQPVMYKGEDINQLSEQANSGDVNASYLLGVVNLYGLAGQKKNLVLAYKYFENAALANHLDGLYEAGQLLLNGQGTHQDTAKAIRYFEKATQLKEPRSAWELGRLFATGKYVQQNHNQAFIYFKQASDANVPQALLNVGLAYITGKGVIADPYQATVYLKRAAEHDIGEAQKALGFLQSRGLQGIVQDPLEAKRWLSLASAKGDRQAEKELLYVQTLLDKQEEHRKDLEYIRVYNNSYWTGELQSWFIYDAFHSFNPSYNYNGNPYYNNYNNSSYNYNQNRYGYNKSSYPIQTTNRWN